MRLEIIVAVLPLAALTLASAGVAGAQEEAARQPLPQAERPLTLPHMTLAPEVGLEVQQTEITTELGSVKQVDLGTNLGAAFGITDDLEVHAELAPVKWTHTVQYGFELVPYPGLPEVGATYRFLKGAFEMGGRLDLELGFINSSNVTKFGIDPGVPMRLHIGKMMRLDAGVFLPITFEKETEASATKPYLGLNVPVSFLVDIIEPLHVAVGTGFQSRFDDFGHDIAIPLGFEVGYAIAGHSPNAPAAPNDGPQLDIDPFFRWPALFLPGAESGIDKVQAGFFIVGVNLRGYLYF